MRLPSLNALRAFESAAKNLSFRHAAGELNVTPGAISQQIKKLEDELGLLLFERRASGLVLTEAGVAYLPSIRRAFQTIADATARLRPKLRPDTLTVSVLPSFAIKWLVPRLGRFHERAPEIDVRVSSTNRLVDFASEDVDIGVRHGLGRWPGVRAWRLADEVLVPVASPALLARKPVACVEDLASHVLLHDGLRRDWPIWISTLGFGGLDPGRGPSFSDDGLLIQAAIDGQGIALARGVMLDRDIAEGRLVQVLDVELPSDFAYYIIVPDRKVDLPKVALFRDWLLEEAEAAGALGHRPARLQP